MSHFPKQNFNIHQPLEKLNAWNGIETAIHEYTTKHILL